MPTFTPGAPPGSTGGGKRRVAAAGGGIGERARFALLSELLKLLSSGVTPREFVQALPEKLPAAAAFDVCLYYEAHQTEGKLDLISSDGIGEQDVGRLREVEHGKGIVGWVAKHRQALVVEQAELGRDERAEWVRETGMLSFCCYPVTSAGHLWGALAAGSRRKSRIHAEDLEMLQALASALAIANERALLAAHGRGDLREETASLLEQAHMLDLARVLICDMDDRIVFWNKGAEEMYGWTRQEALGRNSIALLDTRFPEGRERVYQELLRNGSWTGELRQRRRDGTLMTLAAHWVLHRDSSGHPTAVLKVNNDISGLRRTEQALRESERRYRTLSESVPVIVFTTDLEGQCDYCNQRWFDYSGLSWEETRGHGWKSAVHPADVDATLKRWRQSLAERSAFEIQYRLRSKEGYYRRFLSRAVPLFGEDNEVVKWLGTAMDIEDHRRAEELLQRSRNVESMALLAGGVAHRFNNLLTGILGGASYAAEILPADHPALPILKDVVRASESAAELTAKMLAFSGKGKFLIEPVSISRLVSEACAAFEGESPYPVRFEVMLAENLPPITGDPNQLRQLLAILILNAAESMAGRPGEIRIRTGLRVLAKRVTTSTEELRPGTYVFIEIGDIGRGMDPTTLSKIFDPFFSTKFTGRGLGLSAALGIVRGHKGAIEVSSSPGQGSTFAVLLPVEESPGTEESRKRD